MTSYLAPKEGITAGATPTGPDVSAETAPATTDSSTGAAPAAAATVGAN